MAELQSTALVFVFSGTFLLYALGYVVYLTKFSPLSKFAGPRLWSISRIPWSLHVMRGDLHQQLQSLHDKYGSIIRIAPDELSILSPSSWALYSTRPLFAKDQYVQTPPLNGAHSLFTAEGDTHRRIRGTLISSFSDKALREQSPIIEHYAGRLMSRLQCESQANDQRVVNIQRYFGHASFDIISELCFGEPSTELENTSNHDWINNFFLHAQFSTVRSALTRYPLIDRILSFIFLRLTSKRRAKNWQFNIARVERRLAQGDSKHADFVTPILERIREPKGGKGISKAELTANIMADVIANCELTTVALTTATYLLLKHSVALERLREEITARQFSREQDITVQTTQELPFLKAVINETLRIHHPTPISLPRLIDRTQVIDGHVIPSGTIVGVNLQCIQNSTLNWVNPGNFCPERFLPTSHEYYDEQFDKDVKSAFQPFSTGTRNCIGQNVASAQMRVILARLLWKFTLHLHGDVEENWLDQKAWLVFEPTPLNVVIETQEAATVL